jgi:hypothetical protein
LGPTPDPLKLAIRVYPEPQRDEDGRKRGKLRHWRRPPRMLVFDTETRTDTAQALTFGSYRYFEDRICLEEGMFVGDDLPRVDRAKLEAYVKTHPAATDLRRGVPQLRLMDRQAFLEKLYTAGFDGQGLICGFNLPFDFSRLATRFSATRDKRFAGGFSLVLWGYLKDGEYKENKYRPRVSIKNIDSKRALKGFTSARDPDPVDLIPDWSETGEPEGGPFRGHFLDLRTLAFVLTDRGHTLDSACKAFGVEQGKGSAVHRGVVTADYIDYNRQDVAATAELAFKLLDEYDRFGVDLQETQAYSPASLGKAHLKKMGITPILTRGPFEKRYLGYAESAFFGGRTSAHIRKVPVPVVYTDFLSMYPTVNALMGLWRYLGAAKVAVVPRTVSETTEFLRTITPETLFDPATWTRLPVFARVVPDGDILPTRTKYSLESNDYQVGLNYLYATSSEAKDGPWFALPDLAASVLLTRRIPKIVEAFAIEPRGTVPSLRTITLRGSVPIDPRRDDFFRKVIEERKRLAANSTLSDEERKRLDKALKVLANATSYGIFAEMIREETADKVPVTCFGIDPTPFPCNVANPEHAGLYCFPPLASLITAAARLMLALLERCVTNLGGTYAMEDTDSMAIVATRRGGLIECPGGTDRKRGKPAVRALSWAQVDAIAKRFEQLNPYDRSAIDGSILKIEEDNKDPKTGKRRQLWCLAISAKRYTLFALDRDGEPALLREGVNNAEDRYSEHGLGHLLNPTDPQSEDRAWIAQAWLAMVRRSLGLPTKPLGFEKRVAVGRTTVGSPALMKPLRLLNEDKPYAKQIKPFNFILACHVRKLGHPLGAYPEKFHLIAPYETDPRKWEAMEWINQYSKDGDRYRITASMLHGSRHVARVKSYGDVLREYEYHPEAKCADAKGAPCGKQTVGLLGRRHVAIDGFDYIGKESNKIEQVEEGGVPAESDVYTFYDDSRRDEWETKWLPMLQSTPVPQLLEHGVSRATIYAVRAGRKLYASTRLKLIRALRSI